ncbi:UvrD-helicase domain-containing protein [Paraburkholderia tropica]|uniref:DNA 3'-5' helicase n=1 Tax=Paraburkholderia tropica TaxID=92647 RepID=A0AAQ1GJ83_9BURK|nr:ATP-dependent helicase [Paraburkholderia tropica]RQN34140.1 ATP-dependent helicase [Paraburkholderia tropica]SEK04027.1 Superfamily I DNA or RNA helicase [Paraburkholderia tropica]
MDIWRAGDLNAEQEAAIREPGSILLTACPGSGKTRTLTYKAAYELSQLKSSRQFVCAITYTHRAADEIHDRIERLGVNTSQLWIGTIHSFCLEWILKPYGIYHSSLSRGFRVIDTHEREALLTELCGQYAGMKVTFWDCEFFFTSERCVIPTENAGLREAIREILRQYFRRLAQLRAIDFELILFRAYQIIKTRPGIAKILSNIFPRVLVDEYQDTKEIQYSIVASILKAGAGSTSAFVVGDPNQAIYTSLGGYAIAHADFEAIANVKFKPLALSKNYRSSRRVVDYFSNYNVHKTAIVAEGEDKDYIGVISYNDTVKMDDLEDELVRLIRHSIEDCGFAPGEICIVAPWWTHLASMTRKLVTRLPEYPFDGPGMVPFGRDYDNFWFKVSRLALTVAAPDLYVRRLRWANEVLRDMTAAGVTTAGIDAKVLLRACNRIMLDDADGLVYLRKFFAELFVSLGINFTQFEALQKHYVAFFESSQARVDKLKKDGLECISDTEVFRRVFRTRTGITVSSIHGVKGAEFDAVIAYGLLEGMVPHFSDAEGEESAKKLMYVVASRAKKNLHLISERKRMSRKIEYTPTVVLADYAYNYDVAP